MATKEKGPLISITGELVDPFTQLLESVFLKVTGEQVNMLSAKDNKNYNSLYTKISVALKEQVEGWKISRNTIKRYHEIYSGTHEGSLGIYESYLDNLCKYINEGSWYEYTTPAKSKSLSDPAGASLYKKCRKYIRAVYKAEEKFNAIPILGDTSGRFENLSIADFYTDLSYIDKNSLDSTNTLLKKEKQDYSKRLHTAQRNVSKKLATSIIAKHNRMIIMGNPGTGKSIFSRYLCHDWLKAERTVENLLIHITLKAVNYELKDDCVQNYVQNNYLSEKITKSTEKWPFSDKSMFLLDGYDEITAADKKVLWESLYHWVSDPMYLLFTRPYGILNENISHDGILEILGFNETTRYNYIKGLLAKDTMEHKVSGIIKDIEDNHLLSGFSYNPLMLSFMMTIIINEGMEELKQVSSSFDLQDKVTNWVEKHYKTKPNRTIDYLSEFTNGETLALAMETNQTYVIRKNIKYEKYDRTTDLLSEVGLGRKDANDVNGWRFYFNSATTQEYLAAKRVVPVITPEQVFSLLRNQLHWNFIQMIIGGLCTCDEARVLQTLDYLKTKYEETDNQNIHFLYFVLLGECSMGVMDKVLNPEVIKAICSLLYKATDLEIWRVLIQDSFVKIVSKSGYKIKGVICHSLVQCVSTELDNIPDDFFSDFFQEIIRRSKLISDSRLCEAIKNYLIDLTQKINEIKTAEEEEMHPMEMYENTISTMFQVLIVSCSETISKYKQELSIINDLEYVNYTIILHAITSSHNWAFQEYERFLEKVKKQLSEGFYYDPDRSFAEKSDYLFLLGSKSEGIAYKFRKSDLETKERAKRLLKEAFSLYKIIKKIIEDDSYHDVSFFIDSFNVLQPKGHTGELIKILDDLDPSFQIENIDELQYEKIVKDRIESYLSDKYNWQKLSLLMKTYYYSEIGPEVFSNHSHSLLQIVLSILNNHKFPDKVSDSEESEMIVEHLKKIINSIRYPYDQNSFLKLFLSKPFRENKLVQEKLLPELLSNKKAEPTKYYWDYVSFLAKSGKVARCLSALNNKALYNFRFSYEYLVPVLQDLKKLISAMEIDNAPKFLDAAFVSFFGLGFTVCASIKESRMIHHQYADQVFRELTDILLSKQYIHLYKQSEKNVHHMFEEYTLFPLLLHDLTGNQDIIIRLDLRKYLHDVYMGYEICEKILSLFSLDEIKSYDYLLGQENTKAVIKYYNDYKSFFQPVDTQFFQELL